MGSDGALAVEDGGRVQRVQAPVVENTVDPVGAGDAFSAVLALGIHEGWPLDATLHRAVSFAAELLKVQGATVEDSRLYARHLRRWADAE
jgi:fructokinase